MKFWGRKGRGTVRQKPADSRAPVFSYYEGKRVQSPTSVDRSHVAGAISRLKQLPSALATLGIVISLGYSLTLSTDPIVNIVEADETAVSVLRDEAVYRQEAARLLASSILNRTKVTINTKVLEEKVLAKFPELQRADISLPAFRRRPILNIRSAELVLVLNSPQGAFAMDSAGFARLPTGDLPEALGAGLPVITDDSGLEVEKGKQQMTREEVNYILDVLYQLKAKNITLESLRLPPLPGELQARFAGIPYLVKFNMRGNAREAVGTFIAAKTHLETQNITPSEYIDARVEEKAYYR